MALDLLEDLSRRARQTGHRPFRRYLLERHGFRNRCTIIIGPRGVGKTTCMLQLLGDAMAVPGQKGLYVQADHVALGDTALFDVALEFQQLGGTLLCIDEIHKASDWARQLKSILDTFPELRILASGSSALRLYEGSLELSRRALLRSMQILSLREFIALSTGLRFPSVALEELPVGHEEIAQEIATGMQKAGHRIMAVFKDYLQNGSCPHFLEFEDPADYLSTVEQNARTIIESDLLAVRPNLTGAAVRRLKKLLSVVAASVPFKPDLKHLARLVTVADERTLKGYLELLAHGGLLRMLPAAGRGLRPMEKPEKVYLFDPSLCHALAPGRVPDLGNLRETFLAAMLSADHRLAVPKRADFLVDDSLTLEVGGRKKTSRQLEGQPNAYLALDDLEIGTRRRIPLWLFGFLY